MKYEVTKEEMMAEAVVRMKDLGMMENVVFEFEKGTLNCSEQIGLLEQIGILYGLTDEQKEIVRKYEEESGNLVYHVIRNFTSIGEMLSLLFISGFKEDWESERNMLKNGGYTYAYVVNLNWPECSEMGGIIVQPSFGGLKRTA